VDEALAAELQEVFFAEAAERMQNLERHLLALERAADDTERQSLLVEIFREAHSLKGAAGIVGQAEMATLAHRLEDVFGAMQRGERSMTPALFDAIYRAADGMGSLLKLAAGTSSTAPDVEQLLDGLGRAIAGPAGTPDGGDGVTSSSASPEPEPAPPSPGPAPKGRRSERSPRAQDSVRVATEKLDALMALVGELSVSRVGAGLHLERLDRIEAELAEWASWCRKHRLEGRYGAAQAANGHEDGGVAALLEESEQRVRAALHTISELHRGLAGESRRMAQVAGDLQEGVRRTRMLPLSSILDPFPRLVRDLAREQGKQVRLVMSGGRTEMDRAVLDQIKDALAHLLRNALDHGIEEPGRRTDAGKPAEATVRIAATHRGNAVSIEVEDDGAGIDPDRVRRGAVQRNLVSAEAAASMSDRDALWLIFRSGVSTASGVTQISGRGVGMDVVRQSVERLGGMIDVDSRSGRGTTFTLTLPLTVATTRCLLVRAAGQTFALPITNVARIVRVDPGEIGRAAGQEAIVLDDGPVVVQRLASVLQVVPPEGQPEAARLPVVILGSAERRLGFVVDGLDSAQEVVVKALPHPFERVRYLTGAAILASGDVVVVLSASDLVRSAPRDLEVSPVVRGQEHAAEDPASILVVDDSFTTRTLEKNILEAAGYRVMVASDGDQAWSLLREAVCHLLVADIQMPGMDGFELTSRIRSDERLKHLPVVLVTSLDSPEDRRRGLEAGADAYITKGAFDQVHLVETIRTLI
jgi:two-component system chemotaxis sensor kinase CheA